MQSSPCYMATYTLWNWPYWRGGLTYKYTKYIMTLFGGGVLLWWHYVGNVC